MKRIVYAAVIVVSVCIIGVVVARTQVRDIFSALSPAQQQRCGLHRLSSSELEALSELFSSALQSIQLGDSAISYLKNEGWEEVTVLGTKRMKFDEFSIEDDFVIAETRVWTYILEPRGSSNLRPGKYLGKMGYSSCEVIDSDGDTLRFRTAKTK